MGKTGNETGVWTCRLMKATIHGMIQLGVVDDAKHPVCTMNYSYGKV